MLIRVDDLYSMLSNQNVVVFDCRFTLGRPSEGRSNYLEGHIPGSFYLDLEQDLSGPKAVHGGRHPLPNVTDMAQKLGAAGVDATSRVVVYDDGEGMAARAWWLIRYLGHDDVSVLNGGLGAWTKAGYPLDTRIPVPRMKTFPLQVHQDWIVDVTEVERIVAGQQSAMLFDARAGERFRGEVEPLDPKAGHIPGAYNAPWTDGITPDGEWKEGSLQKERFLKEGLQAVPPEEFIMYCGSGVTACNNLFALELAGIRGAKLYPGSWSDWVSYDEHPVERSAE